MRYHLWIIFFILLSGCSAKLPDVSILKAQYPAVKYQGPDDPPVIEFQKKRPSGWVTISEISKVAVGAVVVSEDWAFYQHKGFDANQIKEAVKEDWEEHRFARGASTITQQVARNVFLSKDKNLLRKVKEFLLAVRLEETLKKPKILEIYLNIAEWGPGIFGIGPASRHYFKKEPKDLNAKEGAFLAMLLPSPIRYGQSFRAKHLTDYAQETIDSILDKMVQARYLTEDQKVAEAARSLPFEKVPEDEPEKSIEPVTSPLPSGSAI